MVTLEMAWQNPKFDLSDYKLKDQQWLPQRWCAATPRPRFLFFYKL
jgi:hypothetical protein